MQLETNVVIAILSGIIPGAVSYGVAMAKIGSLEREHAETLQLLRAINDKLDQLGNRMTRVETKLEIK